MIFWDISVINVLPYKAGLNDFSSLNLWQHGLLRVLVFLLFNVFLTIRQMYPYICFIYYVYNKLCITYNKYVLYIVICICFKIRKFLSFWQFICRDYIHIYNIFLKYKDIKSQNGEFMSMIIMHVLSYALYNSVEQYLSLNSKW